MSVTLTAPPALGLLRPGHQDQLVSAGSRMASKSSVRSTAKGTPRTPTTWSGFVLHQYDWSESSAIVDTFTREAGRVVLVARGAKRPYSQLRAVLLPFQRLQISAGRPPAPAKPAAGTGVMPSAQTAAANANAQDNPAQGDILNLRSAEWVAGHPMPQGAALFSGFYLNELLIKLLARGDPHPRLFDAYAHAVALLAALQEGHEGPVLRAFEWCLLREIGVLPSLAEDTATGEGVDAEAHYRLHAETGLTRRRSLAVNDAATGATASGASLLRGESLLRIEAALGGAQGATLLPHDFAALVQACDDGERDLKPTLREVLHYHLGGSRLRTRDLMRELQNLSAPA